MKWTIIIIAMILAASCADVVNPSLKDRKVTLLAPANNVVSSDSLQTFYWEELEDSLQYQLQVVSPGFDSIVRLEADTTVRRNRLSLKLRPAVYEWRVRALSYGGASMYSDIFRLTIR